MELVKDIFFNTDKIVQNSSLKISYVGSLYGEGAKEVYIHYGFNQTWDGVTDIQMEKTELGFQCEIEIGEYDTLNFCFNDGNGNWDNNDGSDYTFNIEKIENTEEETESELGLTVTGTNDLTIHKNLKKTYIWSKKVKLAVYKIIKFFPKIISGNYKRKVKEN